MINPYTKITGKDIEKMNIKEGMVVVKALTPTDFGSVITLGEFDYTNARAHEVIRTGEKVDIPVGSRCLVLANTLDSADDSGEFCFIEAQDIYAWWNFS